MQIRRLDPGADTDAVVALGLRAWAPVFASVRAMLHGSGVYELQYPGGWETVQRAAITEACTGDAWIADDGGTIAGFVALALPEPELGEIHMIAVDPDRQRRGIGLELTRFGVARLGERGATSVMVETGGDPGHAPARAAYAAAGFVEWPVSRWFRAVGPAE